MATRIEFNNGNAITVVDEYDVVRDDKIAASEGDGTGFVKEYTQRPKDNPGQAQPITVDLNDVSIVRPAHSEKPASKTPQTTGLGDRG